jgi:PAS domain S-box-containing protein
MKDQFSHLHYPELRKKILESSNENILKELETLKKENYALKKAEKQFSMLKQELSVGYAKCEVIYDDKNKPINIKLLEINQTALEILNLQNIDVLGKNITDIYPEVEEKWIQFLSNLANQEEPFPFDTFFPFLSGYFSGKAFSTESGQFTATFRDVTHRRKSEQHLMESEARYRRLVESFPDLVYVYSDKLGGKYYSPNVKETIGYSAEYLIQNPFLIHDSIHPEDVEKVDELMANISDFDTFDIQYRLKDAYGIWHWFRDRMISKAVIDDENIIEGIATDITEYKNLYAALDYEKEQMDVLFNALPAFIYTFNLEYDIIYANEEFVRLFGDPNSKKCYELLFKRNNPCEDCCVSNALLKEQMCSREITLFNGRTYLVSDKILNTEHGETLFIETGIDISDWVETRRQYKESREKYYAIFKNAPLGMFRSTPEGKFLEVNSKLVEILGYDSPEDLMNSVKNIAKEIYVKPEKRDEIVREVISNNGVMHYENVYRKKDGSVIVANLYIKKFYDENGDVRYLEGMVEDISERVMYEKILQESEQTLRTIISNLPHGVFAHGLDGNFTIVNKISARNTGYTEEELLRMNVTHIDPTSITRNDREKIWNKLEKGDFVQIESEHIRKDGSRYPTEITISAIMIKSQRVLLAIAQDITERKNIEKQLKDNEERFKVLFQQAPLSYQSLDADGNIMTVNDEWCKALGYTKEEVIGRNFSEFIHDDYREVFKENFPRFKKVGYILGIEFEMICKDGTEILVSFNGKVLTDDNDNFKQTHCIFHNITEQKRVLNQLEQSEEKFRSFFAHSNDGIAITDEYGCVEEWNEAMESITGISKSHAYGRKIYDVQFEIADHYLDKPELLDQIKEGIEDFFKTGKAPFLDKITETKVKSLDGKHKILQSKIFGFNSDKGYKAASIVRDVTEQKKTEELLLQSKEELQQALSEKDRFFSIIAHDIKNPLSGFINLSKDLAENYFDMAFQDINNYANALYQSSTNLHNLLDNLLEWSRMERDILKVKPEKLSIKDIVDNCCKIYHVYSAEKKVKIMSVIDGDVFCYADKHMISGIFRNLISNSLKFTKKGGLITIKAIKTTKK